MIIVRRNDFLFEIFTLLALSFPPSKYSCKSRLFVSQNGFLQQPIGINLNRTTLTKKNYHTVHYLFFIKTSDFGAEAERSYFNFYFGLWREMKTGSCHEGFQLLRMKSFLIYDGNSVVIDFNSLL